MPPTTPSPLPPPPPIPLFPNRYLTLLTGDVASAKSLLAVHLASRVSRSAPLPPAHDLPPALPVPHEPFTPRPPIAVLASLEDDDLTLSLRLTAAHADLDRVAILQNPSLIPPSPADPSPLLLALRALAQSQPIGLIALDPLPACLGQFDSAHGPTIRRLLAPLLAFANFQDCPLVGICHLNKNTKAHNPLHRSAGSYAYTALARSVLLLTSDPANPTRRLLVPLKNNFAPITRAFPFSIHETPPTDPAAPPIPHLAFDPDTHLPPHHPAAPAEDPIESSQLDFALHYLTTTLADGPVPSARLLAEARALGISRTTLTRARATLPTTCARDPHSKTWLTQLTTPPHPLPA